MNSLIEPPGTTIVIVDDDEILRDLMSAALETEGFTVLAAADGMEALRLCREHDPDLLISDAAMPRMDGFMLCQEIRGAPETANLPILMATGLGDNASIARAFECGATDFVSKPISWAVLPHRVRYMLRAARAFATLQSSHDALRAANEAKSNFLALVSHELRTPLNAIIGFAALMRDRILGPLPDSYASYPGEIAESGEHLLSIINSVLDVANAEQNRITLDRSDIAVDDIVGYVHRIFDAAARNARLELDVSVDGDLPPLHADLAKLRQVMINIVSNAIKFTPEGGWVSLRASLDQDGWLAIRVQDSGIGISPEQIEVALTPFGQVDSRLSRKYDGMGLGLPLSKTLVELHGGTLAIESRINQGTTVLVRIPCGMPLPAAQAAGED